MATIADPKRPIERLASFSDAVIAIAITLLVLPLVDKVTNGGLLTVNTFVDSYLIEIVLFVISFLVIAKFWLVHYSIFQPLKLFSNRLFVLNIIWLLSIVIIPFTTELISQDKSSGQFAVVLYIGMLFITALVGLLMQYEAVRNPQLHHDTPLKVSFAGGIATLTLMGLALLIAIILPSVGLWAMLLLVLSGPLTRLINKKR